VARAQVKEERREQILEGLFEAMAREGSIGASVTDIAKAAGIARGALHYYFASKDEIRRSLMSMLGQRYTGALAAAMQRAAERRPEDAEAPLRALVRYHFAGDEAYAERLLAVWIDFWGNAPTDEGLNAVVLSVQQEARRLCREGLLAARPELRDAEEEPLRYAAATLLALIEGGLLQWRVAAGSHAALDRGVLTSHITDAAVAFVRSLPAPEVS
jgi:AcrR family transcriptional regulator